MTPPLTTRTRRKTAALRELESLRDFNAPAKPELRIQRCEQLLGERVVVTRSTVKALDMHGHGTRYSRESLNLKIMIAEAWSKKNVDASESNDKAQRSFRNPAHDELDHEANEDENDAIAVAAEPGTKYGDRIERHLDQLRTRTELKRNQERARRYTFIDEQLTEDLEVPGSPEVETQSTDAEETSLSREDRSPSKSRLNATVYGHERVLPESGDGSGRKEWEELNACIQILIDAATDELRSDQHDRYPINCPSVISDNIKVYSPTQDVFRDFEKLVTMMEGTSGWKQGVAKIVVPKECIERCRGKHRSLSDTSPASVLYGRSLDRNYNTTALVTQLQPHQVELRRSADDPALYRVESTALPYIPAPEWRRSIEGIIENHVDEIHASSDYRLEVEPMTTNKVLTEMSSQEEFSGAISDTKIGESELGTQFMTVLLTTKNLVAGVLRQSLSCDDPGLSRLSGNRMATFNRSIAGVTQPVFELSITGTPGVALQIERYGGYSLKYHHGGAARIWTVIAPSSFKRLQDFTHSHLGSFGNETSLFVGNEPRDCSPKCSQFVRHHQVYVPEKVLGDVGISFVQIVQRPGELVVMFPYAYFQSRNTGPNIIETMAYGSERWEVMQRDSIYTECTNDPDHCPGHNITDELRLPESPSPFPKAVEEKLGHVGLPTAETNAIHGRSASIDPGRTGSDHVSRPISKIVQLDSPLHIAAQNGEADGERTSAYRVQQRQPQDTTSTLSHHEQGCVEGSDDHPMGHERGLSQSTVEEASRGSPIRRIAGNAPRASPSDEPSPHPIMAEESARAGDQSSLPERTKRQITPPTPPAAKKLVVDLPRRSESEQPAPEHGIGVRGVRVVHRYTDAPQHSRSLSTTSTSATSPQKLSSDINSHFSHDF